MADLLNNTYLEGRREVKIFWKMENNTVEQISSYVIIRLVVPNKNDILQGVECV